MSTSYKVSNSKRKKGTYRWSGSACKSSFDHWKFDNSKFFMQYIDKIADFTGTSVEYLVREQEAGPGAYSQQEKDMTEK